MESTTGDREKKKWRKTSTTSGQNNKVYCLALNENSSSTRKIKYYNIKETR
jgi:hypothetical protein